MWVLVLFVLDDIYVTESVGVVEYISDVLCAKPWYQVLRYTVISGLFIFNAYQFRSKGPVENKNVWIVREKESNDEISHVYAVNEGN